jgi:hypothetical protein
MAADPLGRARSTNSRWSGKPKYPSYQWFLNEFMNNLPPKGVVVLHEVSNEWREDAQWVLEEHKARFMNDGPLSYNLDWPPEAPWPPNHSLERLKAVIPGHLRDMEPEVDVFLATAIRLDGLNAYLLKHQQELKPNVQWDYGPGGAAAPGANGLAATYGPDGKTANMGKFKHDHKSNERKRRKNDPDDSFNPDADWVAEQRRQFDLDILTKEQLILLFNAMAMGIDALGRGREPMGLDRAFGFAADEAPRKSQYDLAGGQ